MKSIVKIALLTTISMTFGCSEAIPDQKFPLSQKQAEALREAMEVSIALPSYNDYRCRDEDFDWRDPYSVASDDWHAYYLTSGNTKMSEEYAKWSCGGELFADLKCPSMTVTEVEGYALVVSFATTKEYHRKEIENCAITLIDNIPTELRPTSDEVRNRDSYKSN